MKSTLETLYAHRHLTKDEAYTILVELAGGMYNHSQMASFLTVYRMRNITVDELNGFREAMLQLCISPDLSDFNTIDLCGTGGDGKNTFNISTLASFVAAGSGVKVSKHGNYSVSSSCGSSNVLEYFGYRFSGDSDKLRRELDQANICFLHAPVFHPAMKNVAPVRKDLGVKTFFNMLGPLVNPTRPANQLVGVFSPEICRLYNYLYQDVGINYTVVHSLDGYDELSLTGAARLESAGGSRILYPEQLGLNRYAPQEIEGGKDIPASAALFKDILEGRGTQAQNDVVVANTALAIQVYHPEKSMKESVEMARDSLMKGKALETFTRLMKMQS